MTEEPLAGPVRVVGAGLLGTSIGLALRRAGVEVSLVDVDAQKVSIATGLGAGRAADGEEETAGLVVVAVPPDHLASEIERALSHTGAVVTDVGSVKSEPLAAVYRRLGPADLARYVGGHPMAGSERTGPLAASADLFDGRPWAVTPHEHSAQAAVAQVHALAERCGAVPVPMAPAEHDLAVARTSHVPHLLAVLAAGRLAEASQTHLVLSGQGVRDVTRVAAGDPALWRQIVAANAAAIGELLSQVSAELASLSAAVAAGDRDSVGELLARGAAGAAAIPGKHGGPPQALGTLFVSVPDHPGELARLLSDAGEIGVNIEDLRIDHDPGRPVGHVELAVSQDRTGYLLEALGERGWTVQR